MILTLLPLGRIPVISVLGMDRGAWGRKRLVWQL